MKLAASIAVGLALVVGLTGCTPSTDAAYKRCVTTGLLLVPTDLDPAEYAKRTVPVAEACLDASKADPAAFNEKWPAN